MSYKIINAATGKPLATKSMGIMMAVQDCLNSSIQQVSSTADTPKFWEMYDAGNGLVKILNNSCGGLVIDIPYSNTANGTQLQMWFDNSGANQHWNIIDVGNGLVKIASSLAIGKLIDIPGGNTADGVDTQIWDDSNSTHQHWQLVTV